MVDWAACMLRVCGDSTHYLPSVLCLLLLVPRLLLLLLIVHALQRSQAVLADCTEPTDVDRKFIISYYIRDFTLAVYEPPMRNSGVIGGQFLKRQR